MLNISHFDSSFLLQHLRSTHNRELYNNYFAIQQLHAFLYISFCHHCITTMRIFLISCFMEDANTRWQFSLCFCELRYSPLEFNSWKIAYICQIKEVGIRAMKFKTTWIHFWVVFLLPLPLLLLKLPNNITVLFL